jgi:hypothetical protein
VWEQLPRLDELGHVCAELKMGMSGTTSTWMLLLMTAACEQTLTGAAPRPPGDSATASDAMDGGGRDASRADGEAADAVALDAGPRDGAGDADDAVDAGGDAMQGLVVVATGEFREEICGNLFDDDDNGMIDDGCICAVGTERACWLGIADARNVGACREGVQRCESAGLYAVWTECYEQVLPTREVIENGTDDDCDGIVDEADGICLPRGDLESGDACGNGVDEDCDTLRDCDDPDCVGQARCPAACADRESLCYGGYDDDCDGQLDCEDTDCGVDPSCDFGACGMGRTAVYHTRDLGSSYGPSSILRGDGQAIMPMTCATTSRCGAGQVGVLLDGGTEICVPPPPECPSGQHPTYVSSGSWRCDPPCDLIIHYGSLFSGENRCAGYPDLVCAGGTVPTFLAGVETWSCVTTCNNTDYDRILLDGSTVCIPC